MKPAGRRQRASAPRIEATKSEIAMSGHCAVGTSSSGHQLVKKKHVRKKERKVKNYHERKKEKKPRMLKNVKETKQHKKEKKTGTQNLKSERRYVGTDMTSKHRQSGTLASQNKMARNGKPGRYMNRVTG